MLSQAPDLILNFLQKPVWKPIATLKEYIPGGRQNARRTQVALALVYQITRCLTALERILRKKGGFLRDAPNAPDTGDTFYGYLNTTLFF